MASEVGIGLVGAGAIGRVHANNLHRNIKGAKLAAVADVDDVRGKGRRSPFGSFTMRYFR